MTKLREIPTKDFRENRETLAAIQDGLSRYNQAKSPDPTARDIALCVEEGNEVVGGLIGRISRCWLRIDTLWVDERYRGLGLGKDLMMRAEALARSEGCHSARLDTYSFQSHGFYHQLGYEEFARLEGLKNGDTHYFLKKRLGPANA
ncbi:MAG: GNAT family N-acetyltransferase [Gemmatimonadales bacterium]